MGRGGRILAGLLLFAAGVLVGANAVYFWMTRDRPDPAATLVFDREQAQHGIPPSPRSPDRATGRSGDPAPPPDTPTADAPVPPSPALDSPRAIRPAPAMAAGRPAPNAAGLVVPVQGIPREALEDTFTDARGQDRSHEALDIMAPRGTPVLAVADGHVEKLFDSEPGGLTIYQFDPAGRHAYYYAHLDRYAPGLEEGDTVEQGEVIGYVGSTGNASDEAPHLHFAIFELGPEKRWWEGTAINPYPVLRGTQSR